MIAGIITHQTMSITWLLAAHGQAAQIVSAPAHQKMHHTRTGNMSRRQAKNPPENFWGRSMGDDDETIIVICQGPPFCLLVFEDAIEAQNNGCLLCKRSDINNALREETAQ